MDRKVAAASLVFFLSLVPVAEAASLEIQQGEVLLSRGTGYQAIHNSMELLVGDTVVSKPGGTAKITFADGCTVYLGMGMVFTVEARSPCSSGGENAGRAADAHASHSSEVAPDPADDGWTSGTDTSATTDDSQTDISHYLLGAAAIGGIAAGLSTLGGSDGGSSPISP